MPQFTPNIQAHCVHVHLMCEMFTVELTQTWLSTIDFTQAQIYFHIILGFTNMCKLMQLHPQYRQYTLPNVELHRKSIKTQ